MSDPVLYHVSAIPKFARWPSSLSSSGSKQNSRLFSFRKTSPVSYSVWWGGGAAFCVLMNIFADSTPHDTSITNRTSTYCKLHFQS